jgi:D-sedoheptulose 7-phosphate isomerase/D-glycero-D-manno-heptose 1,7-bisphosphate phosphatase
MTINSHNNSFLRRKFETAGDYFDAYTKELEAAYSKINRKSLVQAAEMLLSAIERDATIFCCGNGGSASISNHMVCDHQKGIYADTGMQPRIISLSSNIELLTAVSNDIGYEESFAYPLKIHGRKGDLLFAISSSGNSENIVRALQTANELGINSIVMTGFDGGRSFELANLSIHVTADNYGVVEDVHQSCMHVLSQYLRHKNISLDELIHKRF